MLLLAFDSATTACSAAVLRDGGIAAHRHAAMARGQSEHLVPMIEDVMAAAGAAYGELDAIGVTVGPGAYTGVRIGLATARGLALAAAVPLIGVTTTEAVAHGARPDGTDGRDLVVALETKRTGVYLETFAPDLDPRGAPAAVAAEDLAASLPNDPYLLAGDAAARLLTLLPPAQARAATPLSDAPGAPDAAVVAHLAAARLPRGDVPATPQPLYLRPPDVTPPKARRP